MNAPDVCGSAVYRQERCERRESLAGTPGEKTAIWLWDNTTANARPDLGVSESSRPDVIVRGNAFYRKNTVKLGGGMQ